MSNDDKSSNNVELEDEGRRKFFGKTALLGAGAAAAPMTAAMFASTAKANAEEYSKNEAFVGYRVAEDFTSKGAASYCLSQLVSIAQSKLNITLLKARVLENNPVSMHILKKFGFQATGTITNFITLNGNKLSCTDLCVKCV